MTGQGVALGDLCVVAAGAKDSRDIVGDADNPAFFIKLDADFLHFRMRVDDDPTKNDGSLKPIGWAVETDSDVDFQKNRRVEFIIP